MAPAHDLMHSPDKHQVLTHNFSLRFHAQHAATQYNETQRFHSATAIPATARSPAATEPKFFVAAPVNPAAPAEPVFDGETGVMGDPVADAPESEPAPEEATEPAEASGVPRAIGLVPVAKPVDPTTPVELNNF